MATDINKRLNQLRARRDGTTHMAFDSTARIDALSKLLRQDPESWEMRGGVYQPHTRYAIGAMQPVSGTYTRVSLDTANRVANQLTNRFSQAGIDAEFRLQGSVPLDVHIRGVSDVDLLAIDTSFLVYSTYGAMAERGTYISTTKTSVGVLSQLRLQTEINLAAAFPAADIDKAGAKAVKISGGSLPRSVDVVPSHWFDSIGYQSSSSEIDRGIMIYNKNTGQTIENFPFLHIAKIKTRCESIGGGLRKAIRLCKNVRADASIDIKLPSFDIAAIMYHADMNALRVGEYYDLAILAETQRFLDVLACDHVFAKTLQVPDGSRAIFDVEEKLIGLRELSIEMDELLSSVYKENVRNATARLPSEMRAIVRVLAI